MPAPTAEEIDRLPQETVPAMVDAPFTLSVHVPGHDTEPSSQCVTVVPLIENCPVLLAGAQISVFQQDRFPTAHHEEPGHATASPAGAWLQGAANQVWLDGESAGTLGGQAESEHGVDPNRHVPVQAAPPPGLQSPEEKPA